MNIQIESEQDDESDILPIIRDITSKFILEIEYIYDIKYNLNRKSYALSSETNRKSRRTFKSN